MKKLLVLTLLLLINFSAMVSCKPVPGRNSEGSLIESISESKFEEWKSRTDELEIPKVDEEMAGRIHADPDWSEGAGVSEFASFDGFEMNLIGMNKYKEWPNHYSNLTQSTDIKKWICPNNNFNMYNFIKDFSITKEQFTNRKTPADDPDKFTEKELDLLFSGKQEEIYAYFCNPYGLTIGEYFYPPKWLYVHSLDDYIKAGITAEMLEPKLNAIYERFGYEDEKDAININVIPTRIEIIYNNLKKMGI